jgi:hypothetical protein
VPPSVRGKALVAAPNPARSSVTVRFDLPQAGHYRLRLVSLAGETVASLDLGPQPPGPGSVRMFLAGAAPGLYYLAGQLDSGEGFKLQGMFKLAVVGP